MAIDLNSLISAASRKLGVPEDKLRRMVQDGNVDELRSYLGSSQNAAIVKALGDSKLTDSLQKKYMSGNKR